ncbi:MAG: endonuclease G [Maribacter sp.]|jgi:endonuclease G
MIRYLIPLLCFCPFLLFSQNIEDKISDVEQQLVALEKQKKTLIGKREDYKLEFLQQNLKKNGLPLVDEGETLIEHSAMSLVYSEQHEQAKWVAHIIMPDVTKGNVGRSNDFRPDEKVTTGTAVEKDYFLTETGSDGKIKYDGFGYDRGHLAPSADFRWSVKALSESYLYSNMSPQAPDFNREGWGELENMMRGYMYHHPKTMLYIVTGPILEDNLPTIERSVNKLSIPNKFFKVVIDLENKQAIGFVMPNQRLSYPVETFAKSIDEIEELTGIDFFHDLEDGLENQLESIDDVKPWLHQSNKNDVVPISPPSLPKDHFNTVQADRFKNRDKKVTVCGTVVQTHLTKKGAVMLYLDKGMSDASFIVFINKENLSNFSYDPAKELKGSTIMVTDKVATLGKTPTMFISNEKQVALYK